MDLLSDMPAMNLYDPDQRIHTKSVNYPPAKVGARAYVSRSLICEGCIVDGYVEHSVLSPGVHVEEGAVIRDSIVFDDCYIEREATVNRCVLDKDVRVGHGSQLGWGDDHTPNRQDPGHLNSGLTLVGKRAVLPPGLRVGRNCKISPNTQPDDFESQLIPSGETIAAKRGLRTLF